MRTKDTTSTAARPVLVAPIPAQPAEAREREIMHYHGDAIRKMERAYGRSVTEGRVAAMALINQYFNDAFCQGLREAGDEEAADRFETPDAERFEASERDTQSAPTN